MTNKAKSAKKIEPAKAAKKTKPAKLEIVDSESKEVALMKAEIKKTDADLYNQVCNALVESHNCLRQFALTLELHDGNPVIEMMKKHKEIINKFS